jgi:ABC-type nickel/cobalt efflux system permease component RcnA
MVAVVVLVAPGAYAGVTAGAEAGSSATAVWYAVPAAFLLGVLAALAIYSRLQGRRPVPQRVQPLASSAAPNTAAAATLPATVFLLQQGGDGAKHEINHTPFRIGRATERNEVTLKHPSISRRHAQITLRKDGVYEIADMESLNGLFVNDRKVKSSPLADGDIIDIGDLTFRFTTRGE